MKRSDAYKKSTLGTLKQARHDIARDIEEYKARLAKINEELKAFGGYEKNLCREWQEVNTKRVRAERQLQLIHETGHLRGFSDTQYFFHD